MMLVRLRGLAVPPCGTGRPVLRGPLCTTSFALMCGPLCTPSRGLICSSLSPPSPSLGFSFFRLQYAITHWQAPVRIEDLLLLLATGISIAFIVVTIINAVSKLT